MFSELCSFHYLLLPKNAVSIQFHQKPNYLVVLLSSITLYTSFETLEDYSVQYVEDPVLFADPRHTVYNG